MNDKESEITKPYRIQQRTTAGTAQEEQIMVIFYSEHWASSQEENFEGEEREGQAEKDRLRRKREKTMKTGEQRRKRS